MPPDTPIILVSNADEEKHIEKCMWHYKESQIPFSQENEIIPLSYHIKSGDQIIAGINASMYAWNIIYVDMLFVEEAHRKGGLGSHLLEHVEREGKMRGAHLIHLETYDFQAKDFYLALGYEIFGILEDCPKGHQRFFMKKNL